MLNQETSMGQLVVHNSHFTFQRLLNLRNDFRNNKTILSVLRQWTSLFVSKNYDCMPSTRVRKRLFFEFTKRIGFIFLVKTKIKYLKVTTFVHRSSWRSFPQSPQAGSGIVTRSRHNRFLSNPLL
jgi:hypothetical protein